MRVIDTKFGRQRFAYFDIGDSLLYAEVEGGRTTTYGSTGRPRGVLTPFEVGGGYRWHTQLNTGLTADRFEVPEQISWEPESVRIVVFEHAPVPPGGPAALRLQVEDLTQAPRPQDDPLEQPRVRRGARLEDLTATRGWRPEPRPWLESMEMHLIDTYMKRKLQAAGVLAGTDPPEWRLTWRVEEFWVRTNRRPPVASIVISVGLQSLRGESLWEGEVRDQWKLLGPPIDGGTADGLTSQVISRASAGMKQLLDAREAAAQPASTPSAGSSSGSE